MSDNPVMTTQAQYSRHRNKSPQYIGKLAKAGILVMRGRMVDAAASDTVLDDKPAERTAPDGQPPTSYAQAKLADMVFRAKLRRLEFDTRQGKLIMRSGMSSVRTELSLMQTVHAGTFLAQKEKAAVSC